MLTTDAVQARATAAAVLRFYRRAPGYRTMWKSCGFSDADIDDATNKWVDAIVAWGDETALRKRIDEHFAAGADHVCVQPLHPEEGFGSVDERAIAALGNPH